MKAILVFAGLCALAVAVPTKYVPKKYTIGDKKFLERQETILRFFKYVNQPTYYKDFVDIAHTYSPEEHYDWYKYPQYVKEFFHYYQHDILPKGEIFSVFYEEHLKQAIALFKMFYFAKDYETFYKTAAWARYYVNEGMWLYAFSVAVIHRPDTYGIVLPPIYEIYPYYFYNSEVIHKAQQYKQIYYGEEVPHSKDGYTGYTIFSNYSGWYLNLHPEQSMSYFTEDIGINAYYYYYNLYYPWWMGGEEFHLKDDRRGELYYYVHQQLLARYYLERLSNNFGEIPVIHFDSPIETGYYPSLQYPTGLEFPVRPNHVYVNKHWDYNHPHYSNYSNAYTYVYDYARRIRDAIDSGYVWTHDGQKVYIFHETGFETLGYLIEGNPDSPNSYFYGSIQVFVRHLLGYTHFPLHKYKIAPSVLEHFETSLRDPTFYQFYKWIINYFQEFKTHLPHYRWSDLEFPGVKIESFKVDRLITYFEHFYSDLSHGVYYNKKEYESEGFNFRVQQWRLNHKPFTYTINVNSGKPVDAVVRVYIGPKYDEYGREFDINENRLNFVEFDRFYYTLKAGQNAIVRNSRDSFFVPDRTTYKELYKQVLTAYKGGEKFHIHGSETYFGFPNRYLLPKGKFGGQTFQFYVIVSPYHAPSSAEKYEEFYYPRVGSGSWKYVDTLPFGYPFDRYIDYGSFFVPNSYFQDAVIYHKKYEELNASTHV